MEMGLRPAERVALGVSIAVLLFAAGVWITLSLTGQLLPHLVGKVLDPPKPAFDFTLEDQNGTAYHLADATGKVVVLALIYTSCGDECPFIAEKLKVAHDLLGPDAEQVDFVPITVDPQNDTPARLLAYSAEFDMSKTWHFLTGTEAQLKPVWNAYRGMVNPPMDMSKMSASDAAAVTAGLTPTQLDTGRKVLARFAGGDDMDHAMVLWLIDRKLRVIGIVDASRTPEDIVHDIRVLIHT